MSEGLLKMAEGYALLAEGIRAIAKADGGKETEAPKAAVQKKAKEAEASEKKVTIEEARAVMAEKSRDGKTQEVRKILNEFGVDKLSAIPEDKLPELLKKVEVL